MPLVEVATWANTFNSSLLPQPATFNLKRAAKLAEKAGYPYVSFNGYVYLIEEELGEAVCTIEALGEPRQTAAADVYFLDEVLGVLNSIDEEMDGGADLTPDTRDDFFYLMGAVTTRLHAIRGTEDVADAEDEPEVEIEE